MTIDDGIILSNRTIRSCSTANLKHKNFLFDSYPVFVLSNYCLMIMNDNMTFLRNYLVVSSLSRKFSRLINFAKPTSQ